MMRRRMIPPSMMAVINPPRTLPVPRGADILDRGGGVVVECGVQR